MKKKLLSVVCLMATACFMVTACGSSTADNAGDDAETTVDVSADELAEALATDVTYSEELTKLDTDLISNYITVEDGVEAVMYVSSGTSGEEVAVFVAKDEATAAKMKDNTQEFLDDQYDSFKDYIPEAADRVKGAVVETRGNVVVVCVTDDKDAATGVIDNKLGK